jgi:hypothetical protein
LVLLLFGVLESGGSSPRLLKHPFQRRFKLVRESVPFQEARDACLPLLRKPRQFLYPAEIELIECGVSCEFIAELLSK